MGLIIVGIGWNLGYVGSSVLFTKSYCPEEKMKAHSLYEAILMFSISISFFSSAFAEQFLGWKTLTGMLIRIYMAAAVLIVAVDTAFVFYKTKNIRIEITCNDKQLKCINLKNNIKSIIYFTKQICKSRTLPTSYQVSVVNISLVQKSRRLSVANLKVELTFYHTHINDSLFALFRICNET
ncbi:unnamed protein product [Rotaria sp. Silwood2]|nr:unnamed protein product [Rotaria sp. Silwood2]